MKNIITSFLIPFLFLASCKKLDIADGTPRWVKQEIKKLRKNTPCSDAQVDEYEFQSETYYVFSPGQCNADAANFVYDSKGNWKGVIGGPGGNTKIDRQEFSSAKFIQNVWHK